MYPIPRWFHSHLRFVGGHTEECCTVAHANGKDGRHAIEVYTKGG